MIKKYSDVTVAVDLVQDAYGLTNPFDIQAKIEEELDMEIHINQILDYLEIEEDYEKESRFIKERYYGY